MLPKDPPWPLEAVSPIALEELPQVATGKGCVGSWGCILAHYARLFLHDLRDLRTISGACYARYDEGFYACPFQIFAYIFVASFPTALLSGFALIAGLTVSAE